MSVKLKRRRGWVSTVMEGARAQWDPNAHHWVAEVSIPMTVGNTVVSTVRVAKVGQTKEMSLFALIAELRKIQADGSYSVLQGHEVKPA